MQIMASFRLQTIALLVICVNSIQGSRSYPPLGKAYEDWAVMICNTTRNVTESQLKSMDPSILIEEPVFHPGHLNSSYHCIYEIIAPKSYQMEVTVQEMITGHRNFNFSSRSCGTRNFLRIWDGIDNNVWKPTEMCGHYLSGAIMTTRIISSNSTKIEFRVQKYTESSAYDVRVRFRKLVCNWEIDVSKCRGNCELVTPGYPGIYPPSIECSYKLYNSDGERVQLYLAGDHTNKGKFDIKRTPSCQEDKVIIYDGDTNKFPQIGIFCGHNVPLIVSSGSALTVEFKAKAGGPRWDYTGFDARVTSRWSSDFSTGMRISQTECSWEFNSTIDDWGRVHTPDYRIEEEHIMCEYHFFIEQTKYMDLKIVFYKLKLNMAEFIDIQDGTNLERIWSEHSTDERNEKKYESKSNHVIVRYSMNGGQTSKQNPVFITYEFMKKDKVGLEVSNLQVIDTAQKLGQGNTTPNDASGSSSRDVIMLLVVSIVLNIFSLSF